MTTEPVTVTDRTAVTLRLFGERWKVDLTEYDAAGALTARIAHLWGRVTDDDAPADVVFRPTPGVSDDPDTLLNPHLTERLDGSFPYAFSGALTRAAIRRHIGSGLLLHAAGLASTDGRRGVVLVAGSGTGKSTASRTLGARFGYISDELMRIDEDHRVEGLPKPLSIVVRGFPGGKDESSADDLGLGPTPPGPVALAAVICLDRSPDAAEVTLERIDVHDLIENVIPQSSSLWRVPRALHRLVTAASVGGGPYRLRYTEIADAVTHVETLLEGSTTNDATPSTPWQGHPPAPGEEWTEKDRTTAFPEHPTLDGTTVIARGAWTDAVEADGEVSVLRGSRFVRIAGIAATIWIACGQARTLDDLVAALVAEHGEHPAARDLAVTAVHSLLGEGLLQVSDPALRR